SPSRAAARPPARAPRVVPRCSSVRVVRLPPTPMGVQLGVGDLGPPLSGVPFAVLDLETTGTSTTSSRITEIGAVKVREGKIVAEFSTLVDPECPVPADITLLTGITRSMVACAPQLQEVLPGLVAFIVADMVESVLV